MDRHLVSHSDKYSSSLAPAARWLSRTENKSKNKLTFRALERTIRSLRGTLKTISFISAIKSIKKSIRSFIGKLFVFLNYIFFSLSVLCTHIARFDTRILPNRTSRSNCSRNKEKMPIYHALSIKFREKVISCLVARNSSSLLNKLLTIPRRYCVRGLKTYSTQFLCSIHNRPQNHHFSHQNNKGPKEKT